MLLYKSLIFLVLLLVLRSSILAFRYSSLQCLDYLRCFGLDLVTTSFYPAFFDLKIASILHQTMVNAASIRTDLDGL